MLNIYDDYAKIDDNVRIADSAKIGYSATIGNYVELGDYVEIGYFAEIGYSARIGHSAKIDDNVRIADGAKIGDWATIGDNVEIGDGAELGDNVRIGSKFRCEDLNVIDFFSMSNVDGTGRKIYVYVHTEGITIRAGCFKGTLDEFCMKAKDEGKTLYARTVRAAAEAFASEVHRQGKTGGWDK